MARTGRFGRLPRSAPNLTSTMVALAREINSIEDANIVKAWNEGGEFDGVKVSDEMLMKHLTKRRDSIGRTDPLWEHWDNLHKTYDFAINESKMTLKYAQHGATEMDMANFYTEWAAKLPVESEVYRDLMRSAAQFLDAAKARAEREAAEAARAAGGSGGSGGRRASSGRKSSGGGSKKKKSSGGSGYGTDGDTVGAMSAYDRYESKYDAAQSLLLQAAYREGILQETDTEDPDDLMDLRVGDEQDHARFMNLFDLINRDPKYADMKAWLAEQGIANLTYGQWVGWSDSKETGIEARLEIARRDGSTKTEIKAIEKELHNHILQAGQAKDLDEYASYQKLTRHTERSLSQPGLNPWEEAEILERYRGGMNSLYGDLQGEQSRGFINNQMRAFDMGEVVGSGPTMAEGNEGGIRGPEDDAGFWGGVYRGVYDAIGAIESGQAYLHLTTDEDGFEAYTAIPKGSVDATDKHRGSLLWAPTVKGGPSVPMYVEYKPIFAQAATAVDPRTGRPTLNVETVGDSQVGSYTVINGHSYYLVPDPARQGEMLVFADDNPFNVPQKDWTMDENGSMVLNVIMPGEAAEFDPGSTIDASGEAPDWKFRAQGIRSRIFNPSSVIQGFAVDERVPRTMRHQSLTEASAYTDPVVAAALVATTGKQQATMLAELYGEDIEGAEAQWADWASVRDNAVRVHNQGVNLAAAEAAKYGLGTISDIQPRDLRRAGLSGRSQTERDRETKAEGLAASGAEWEKQRKQQSGFDVRRTRMSQSATANIVGAARAAAPNLFGADSTPGAGASGSFSAGGYGDGRTNLTGGTDRGRISPLIKLPSLGDSSVAAARQGSGPRMLDEMPSRRAPPVSSVGAQMVRPERPTPLPLPAVQRNTAAPRALPAAKPTKGQAAPRGIDEVEEARLEREDAAAAARERAATKPKKSIKKVSAPRFGKASQARYRVL